MSTPSHSTPRIPAAPRPTPLSSSLRPGSTRSALRAPVQNPFDKFSQNEFDAWIGGITGALRQALGHEQEEKEVEHKPKAANGVPQAVDDDVGMDLGQEDESFVEDSFAEFKARRAAGKGKDRDPREGPGLGGAEGWNKERPIEILSDEEEEQESGSDEDEELSTVFIPEAELTEDDLDAEEETYEEYEEVTEVHGDSEHRHLSADFEDEDEVSSEIGAAPVVRSQISPQRASPSESYGHEFEEDEDGEFLESWDGPEEEDEPQRYYAAQKQRSPDIIELDSDGGEKEPENLDQSFEELDEEEEEADEFDQQSSPPIAVDEEQEDDFTGTDFAHSEAVDENREGGSPPRHVQEMEDDDVQPLDDDTSFPPLPMQPLPNETPQSFDIRDPWAGPQMYAEDFYSGGDQPLVHGRNLVADQLGDEVEQSAFDGGVQPLAEDTSFPPAAHEELVGDIVPVDLPDVWVGPELYAEDFYSGGDLKVVEGQSMDPDHLGHEDEYGQAPTSAIDQLQTSIPVETAAGASPLHVEEPNDTQALHSSPLRPNAFQPSHPDVKEGASDKAEDWHNLVGSQKQEIPIETLSLQAVETIHTESESLASDEEIVEVDINGIELTEIKPQTETMDLVPDTQQIPGSLRLDTKEEPVIMVPDMSPIIQPLIAMEERISAFATHDEGVAPAQGIYGDSGEGVQSAEAGEGKGTMPINDSAELEMVHPKAIHQVSPIEFVTPNILPTTSGPPTSKAEETVKSSVMDTEEAAVELLFEEMDTEIIIPEPFEVGPTTAESPDIDMTGRPKIEQPEATPEGDTSTFGISRSDVEEPQTATDSDVPMPPSERLEFEKQQVHVIETDLDDEPAALKDPSPISPIAPVTRILQVDRSPPFAPLGQISEYSIEDASTSAPKPVSHKIEIEEISDEEEDKPDDRTTQEATGFTFSQFEEADAGDEERMWAEPQYTVIEAGSDDVTDEDADGELDQDVEILSVSSGAAILDRAEHIAYSVEVEEFWTEAEGVHSEVSSLADAEEIVSLEVPMLGDLPEAVSTLTEGSLGNDGFTMQGPLDFVHQENAAEGNEQLLHDILKVDYLASHSLPADRGGHDASSSEEKIFDPESMETVTDSPGVKMMAEFPANIPQDEAVSSEFPAFNDVAVKLPDQEHLPSAPSSPPSELQGSQAAQPIEQTASTSEFQSVSSLQAPLEPVPVLSAHIVSASATLQSTSNSALPPEPTMYPILSRLATEFTLLSEPFPASLSTPGQRYYAHPNPDFVAPDADEHLRSQPLPTTSLEPYFDMVLQYPPDSPSPQPVASTSQMNTTSLESPGPAGKRPTPTAAIEDDNDADGEIDPEFLTKTTNQSPLCTSEPAKSILQEGPSKSMRPELTLLPGEVKGNVSDISEFAQEQTEVQAPATPKLPDTISKRDSEDQPPQVPPDDKPKVAEATTVNPLVTPDTSTNTPARSQPSGKRKRGLSSPKKGSRSTGGSALKSTSQKKSKEKEKTSKLDSVIPPDGGETIHVKPRKKGKGKEKEQDLSAPGESSGKSAVHSSASVRSISSASSAARLLLPQSRTTSRASSIASSAASEGSGPHQPSPTVHKPNMKPPQPILPLQPLVHAHVQKRKHHPNLPLTISAQQHLRHIRGPSFPRRAERQPSAPQSPTPSQAHSTDFAPIAATPGTASSTTSSPVTRSHCKFHKISIPKEEDGPRIYFLVPGCCLTKEEVITDEEIVDHGYATLEDGKSKIDDIESLGFEDDLIRILRLLVGADILRENEIFYLPLPGEEIQRKATISRIPTMKAPTSTAGSTSTSISAMLHTEMASDRGSFSASTDDDDGDEGSDYENPPAKKARAVRDHKTMPARKFADGAAPSPIIKPLKTHQSEPAHVVTPQVHKRPRPSATQDVFESTEARQAKKLKAHHTSDATEPH